MVTTARNVDAAGMAPQCATERVENVDHELSRRLRTSGYYSLRGVRYKYHEGVLTLWGRLPSYYLRQIATNLATKVDGVDEIVDRIEVGQAWRDSQTGPDTQDGLSPQRRRWR